MRAMICGDTHGNLPALEKVLKTERNNYDLFISHGDVVNYAPWSNECVDLIISIDKNITLLGNHEENFIKGNYGGSNLVATAFFEFCFPFFERIEIIKGFQLSYQLDHYTVQHTIDDQYIFPDSDIEPLMKGKYSDFIIGHSHHQFMSQASNGYVLYNTGSIGQNRKNLNIINYIMYDSEVEKLELKSLVYDAGIVINEMKSKKYPEICVQYYQSKINK